MIEENQDSFFRDKLYDLESPLNEKVSFEAVMEKRKKKRRVIFWWNPKVYVVAGLFVVGGLALFLSNPFEKTNKPVSTKELTNKVSIVVPKDDSKDKIQKSEGLNESETVNSNDIKVHQNELNLGEATLKTQGVSSKQKNLKHQSVDASAIKTRNNSRRGFSYQDQAVEMNGEQIFETSKEYLKLDRSNVKQYSLGEHISSKASAEETYTWNNVFDVLNSKKPSVFRFKMPEFDLASFNIDLEGKERPVKLKLRPSKWFAELSVITGSNNTINFEDNVPLSILGTQYMAQYQLLILKDLENGSMLGAGVQYSEWVGNGQWQMNKNEMVRDIKKR